MSKTTGEPWCKACKQRWARCSRRAQVARVRGGTRDQSLCAACTRPDPGFWRSCPGCGEQDRIRTGRCMLCQLRQRLPDLVGDETGTIRPGLQALHDNLAGCERPATVIRWLDKSAAPAISRELCAGQRPLTHAALDDLPDGQASAAPARGPGSPPERCRHVMSRWPGWDAGRGGHRRTPWRRPAAVPAPLRVIRRLRGRLNGTHTTHGQAVPAQQNIKAAIALLDWLTARGLTLHSVRQGDLEAWLASTQATHRTDAGNFVR